VSEEATKSTPIQVWSDGSIKQSKDYLVNESALQVLVEIDGVQKALSMLLRTPGDDTDLVIGWLLGEALIKSNSGIIAIRCEDAKAVAELDPKLYSLADFTERQFAVSSSCGLCGRESLDGLEIPSRLALSDECWVLPSIVTGLPQGLNDSQAHFKTTGGLHASALFDEHGKLLDVREDVGRHNALDKLIGSRLVLGELPAENQILMLSGRISYELIQKAAFAGIPVIAGLGAPSSMAVDAARSAGLTLIGFLKSNRFNVYSGGWRVQ
jgi:FdhD protein